MENGKLKHGEILKERPKQMSYKFSLIFIFMKLRCISYLVICLPSPRHAPYTKHFFRGVHFQLMSV